MRESDLANTCQLATRTTTHAYSQASDIY